MLHVNTGAQTSRKILKKEKKKVIPGAMDKNSGADLLSCSLSVKRNAALSAAHDNSRISLIHLFCRYF